MVVTKKVNKMDIEGQIADACNEAYLRAGAEFAIDRIIDYIENDAKILIPSIEFLGNPLTKEEYGCYDCDWREKETT